MPARELEYRSFARTYLQDPKGIEKKLPMLQTLFQFNVFSTYNFLKSAGNLESVNTNGYPYHIRKVVEYVIKGKENINELII